jgi:hypothetical protein
MGIPVGSAWDGLRAGSALAVGVGRAVAAPSAWPGEPVTGRPAPAGHGLPAICSCYGTRRRRGRFTASAVVLDDRGDLLGADAMKVQVKAAGTFTRGCGG